MKLYLTVLFLFLIGFENVFGQKTTADKANQQLPQKVILPLFKESHRIDVFLDSFFSYLEKRGIKHGKYFSFENENLTACCTLDLREDSCNKNREIFLTLPPSAYLKEAGYINYKGYTIFIINFNSVPYPLFEKANESEPFNFLHGPYSYTTADLINPIWQKSYSVSYDLQTNIFITKRYATDNSDEEFRVDVSGFQ